MHRALSLITFFASLSVASLVFAGGRSALISQNEAQRFGLERAWFTRVAIDSGSGEIAHVSQHVSSTKSYTVHQIHYDGGKISLSERDADRYGELLGEQSALKLANRRLEELEDAGLNPKLESHVVPAVTLYVSTNRGVVQAIDAETGRTLWISEVGRPGQAIEAPGANDRYVGVVNRTSVFVLNAEDGKTVWQRKVRGAPSGGPTVTEELLFIPMLDGRIEAYDLQDYQRTPWIFQPTGHSVPLIYNGNVVVWPTDRGHLYVAQGNMRNVLFQVELSRSIAARATALHPGRLLTASTDGYVYCVEEAAGAILWRFSTGDRISSACFVVGETIFVVTEGSNLFRISGETGLEEWPLPTTGVRRFLSASNERLYCVDRSGHLLVIDAASGAKLGTLRSVTPNLRVPNAQTDRIFVGTRGGMIQCLHEVANEFPVIHLDAAELTMPETASDQPASETTAPAAEPAADTDPFGAPAAPSSPDVDPFGGADSNPFGTPDPSSDTDPFSSDDPFSP